MTINSVENDVWTKFFSEILVKELGSSDIVMYSSLTHIDAINLYKLLRNDYPIRVQAATRPPKSVIITFESYNDLKETLLKISKTNWNPRANFTLISIEQNVLEADEYFQTVFRLLWNDYFIINSVIVRNVGDQVEIFNWFPYSLESNCGKEVKLSKMIYRDNGLYLSSPTASKYHPCRVNRQNRFSSASFRPACPRQNPLDGRRHFCQHCRVCSVSFRFKASPYCLLR